MTVGLLINKLRLQRLLNNSAHCSLFSHYRCTLHNFVRSKVSILDGYHPKDIQYPLEKISIAAIPRYR